MKGCYKLSIIIPVFGVEKYIDDFINSLFPQINEFVECIFVDDGCLDSSIKKLEKHLEFFENEKNIKIISQKNGGIGNARNTGLNAVTGDFITFLDPDDMVKENYINQILKAIDSGDDIDIIHINADVLRIDGSKSQIKICNQFGLIEINEKYLLSHFENNSWQPWLRIFNRNLLVNFKFPENCIFEDLLSFPELYKNDMKVYEINENIIIYRLTGGSATGRKDKRFHDSYRIAINYYEKKAKNNIYKVIYFRTLDNLFILHLKSNDFHGFKVFVKEYNLHIKNCRNLLITNNVKEKFRYAFPILFYIYKTRFFLKKFK